MERILFLILTVFVCGCSQLGKIQYYEAMGSKEKDRKDVSIIGRNWQTMEKWLDRTHRVDGLTVLAGGLPQQTYTIGPIILPVIPVAPFIENKKADDQTEIELRLCNKNKELARYTHPIISYGENLESKCSTTDEINYHACMTFKCSATISKAKSYKVKPITLTYKNGESTVSETMEFIFRDEIHYIWSVPLAP